jgi:hypothetical protein
MELLFIIVSAVLFSFLAVALGADSRESYRDDWAHRQTR